MSYTKTTWVNDSPPDINAANLNKIEQGIYDAHQSIDENVGSLAPAETSPTTSAHANLDYITYNGKLYQVVVAMGAGTTLEPGVNIIETTVADALDEKITKPSTGTTGQYLKKTADSAEWANITQAWGNITGNLSDQDDLNNALSTLNSNLSAKANKTEVDTALAQKQNKLTFDTTPTAGSTNPVTSDGIAAEISALNSNLRQKANASDVATALANQKYFYIDSEGYGCINYDLFQTA